MRLVTCLCSSALAIAACSGDSSPSNPVHDGGIDGAASDGGDDGDPDTPGFGEEVDLAVSGTYSTIARVTPAGIVYVSVLPLKWSADGMRLEQFADGTVAFGGYVTGIRTFGPGEVNETTVGTDPANRTPA